MKYSRRQDQYCCSVLTSNFREIDERLSDLENGGSIGIPTFIVQDNRIYMKTSGVVDFCVYQNRLYVKIA